MPIAIGILLASGQLQADVTKALFMGDLSLDGRVRHTNGVLSHALLAREQHMQQLFVLIDDAEEAMCIAGVDIFPVDNLKNLYLHVSNQLAIKPPSYSLIDVDNMSITFGHHMKDLKGQGKAKRALGIAVAG